ncbi:DNRLRE domain-containing protein [Pontibacillus sp. ALD_SL1]|uniref:DNRLRE domain-containing protein n=1 Tax=Pontibacillus sp. ALD_SL1 TaxID=2777185 RepID=UPI001A966D97|nr:DNRLRE domain-containing protein [Pontibacillus sp. ALD_SL1]QST00325.1 DNRLRE domain-containing protein [Pontibacillus sp. ALD_SL1]
MKIDKAIALLLSVLLLANPMLVQASSLDDPPKRENLPTHAKDAVEGGGQQVSNHETELEDYRTKYSKRYLKEDGTYREKIYKNPIHFKENGNWKKINEKLVSENNDTLTNKSNSFDISLKKTLSKGYISIGKGKEKIQFRPLFLQQPTKATVEDDVLTYPNVAKETDLQYVSTSTGLKEILILKGKEAPTTFEFDFKVKEYKYELTDDGELIFFKEDNKEEPIFTLDKPVIIDEVAEDNVVSYSISEKSKNKFTFKMTVDEDWINSEDREFPIYLDPTINETKQEETIDTFIAEMYPQSDYNHWSHYYVGEGDDFGKTRALISFVLPNLPTGSKIDSADLVMDNTTVYSQYQEPVLQASRITSDWYNGGVSWSNQPTTGSVNHEKKLTSKTSGTLNMPVTNIVKDWYNGKDNYGLQLKYKNEGNLIREFLSSNSTANSDGVPYIDITYSIDGLGKQPFWTYDGPVNMANRNLMLSFTDAQFPGKGVSLNVQRTFNSRSEDVGLFGYGWSSPFDMELRIGEYGPAQLVDGTGTSIYFKYNNDGTYDSPEGLYWDLYRTSETEAEIVTTSNIVYTFDLTTSKITKIKDAKGSSLNFNYSSGQLDSIDDGKGHAITFNVSNGLIDSAEDPAGRVWNYEYSGNLLTGLTTPDGESMSYSYNDENNLVYQMSPAGSTSYYSYSANDRLTAINPTNAISNANFETDADGDSLSDHFTFGSGVDLPLQIDGSVSYFNDFSVSLSADSSDYNDYTYYLSDPIYLDTSKTYTLSGYTKLVENSGDFGSVISILAYDDNDNYLGEVGRIDHSGTTGWDRGSSTINSFPSGTDRVYVKIGASAKSGSGKVWFDGLQLEQGNLSSFINGDQYTASLSLKKSAIYDGEGRKTLYSYNEHQNVTKIQADPNGANVTTTYDWDRDIKHYLTSVTDPESNVWGYELDQDSGNIIKVTNPNGDSTGYSYDGESNLTEFRDLNNEKYKMTYDKEGQQWTSRDPYYRTNAVRYEDDNLSLSSPTLGLADNLVINSNFESSFDNNGLPDGWNYDGGQTGYVERVKESVYGSNSLSFTNSNSYSLPHTIVSSDETDVDVSEDYVVSGYIKVNEDSGEQLGIISVLANLDDGSTVELGRTEVTGTQGWQQLKTVLQAVEIPDNATSIRLKLGGSNNTGTGQVYFDGVQLQKYAVDTNLNLVNNPSFERDDDSDGWPDGWTKPTGVYSVTTVGEETFTGSNAVKVQNPTESRAVRPTNFIPYDNSNGESYHFTAFVKTENYELDRNHIKFEMYDSDKNIIERVVSEKIGGDTPWRKLTIEVDPQDIPTNTAYIRPGLMPGMSKGTVYFDNVRLQLGKWNTHYNFDSSNTWLKEIKDPMGNTKTFTYTTSNHPENIGEPRIIKDENGNVQDIEYKDGTDLEEKVTTNDKLVLDYDYNKDGDLTALRSVDNGVTKAETKYAYTKDGNMKSYTDVIGSDDEDTSETNDRVTSFSYTPSGLTDTVTRANQDTISYQYNDLGQVTTLSTNQTTKFTYDYDVNGNVEQVDAPRYNRTWDMSYNNLNLMTSYTDNSANLTYERNNEGQITKQTFQLGQDTKSETTTYNRVGQPSTFRNSIGETSEILYDEHGKLSWLRNGTKAETAISYASNGRIDTFTSREFRGDLFIQDEYEYDGDTQKLITQITNKDGEQLNYDYDQYGQLKKETLPSGGSYEYNYTLEGMRSQKVVKDASGSIVDTKDYQFGEAHQLQSVGNTDIEHTKNGQISNDGTYSYKWDAEGNLIEVWDSSNTNQLAAYRYDDQGRRIYQDIGGEVTQFVYNGKNNEVVAELDENDNLQKYYTWSPTGHLLNIEVDGQTYYPIFNGHGDITKIIDSNQEVVATYTYDSFGNIIDSSGQTEISPYRYAGYRYDEVTGLYYLNDRHYHSEFGQFLSADPQGELPDYTYANNNPLTFVDPSGNFILDVISTVVDAVTFAKDPSVENGLMLASNAVSLFIPGNISMAAKAAKGLRNTSKSADAGRVIGRIDPLSSGGKDISASTPKTKNPASKKKDVSSGSPSVKGTSNADVEVTTPSNRYPETSKHIQEAQKAGHLDTLTIDRSGAKSRRRDSLRGREKVPGKDLDEYPPAMFKEGGKGASVRPVSPSDNRGAGAYLGNKLRNYPDGTKVRLK